jgi:Skp family chaperone for outer membrane proteins
MNPMPAKLPKFVFGLALAALPVSLFAQPAQPGGSPPGTTPAKIGLVNILEAIAATNEGQKEIIDLNNRFAPKQAELRALKDEIDRLKKELDAQSTKLSDDERNSKVRTIETKQKILERNYEDAQAEYQQAQQDISGRIYQKMTTVLEKYATSNGLAVVLDVSGQQNTVLWGNTGTLITKPLVDAYNAQSPVPPPAAPASGAQSQSPAGQAPVAATPKKP